MIRSTFTAATVAAVMSMGALGFAAATPASAHHWHGDVSIHIGHGLHGIYLSHGCRRFYRRYLATGHLYWLDRYEACRYGY